MRLSLCSGAMILVLGGVAVGLQGCRASRSVSSGGQQEASVSTVEDRLPEESCYQVVKEEGSVAAPFKGATELKITDLGQARNDGRIRFGIFVGKNTFQNAPFGLVGDTPDCMQSQCFAFESFPEATQRVVLQMKDRDDEGNSRVALIFPAGKTTSAVEPSDARLILKVGSCD
jgi:hypothetical protein